MRECLADLLNNRRRRDFKSILQLQDAGYNLLDSPLIVLLARLVPHINLDQGF